MIGSGAHQTSVMRRPTAARVASRRAVSTSGSSGTRPLLLGDDLEQLDLEDQRGARLDARRRAAVAVGDLRGTDEAALAAGLHELHALGPALDDAVQRERRRLP